jgi:hypothetical protein
VCLKNHKRKEMYVCRTRKEFGGFFNISGKPNIKSAKDKHFRCISAKRSKNRQFTIWLMAPCNMRYKK